MKVEAAVHTSKGFHTRADLFSGEPGNLCESHRSNAILDVHSHRHSQLNVADVAEGRDKVKTDLSTADADVGGVEITGFAGVSVGGDAGGRVGLHLQPCVQDEKPSELDEFRVVAEALEVGLFCAIDVQVVGIRGGDDCGKGRESVEGAVELIGLDDDIVAFGREDVVRTIVLGDASEEGVAVHMALV